MRLRSLPLLALVIALPHMANAAHPVFDLIANRTLAHASRSGQLLLVAGSPGFAKYIHFSRPLPTWRLGATVDGKQVALARTQAVLEVPLARPAKNLVTRLFSPARQTIRVTMSGKASAAIPLAIGWQTVTVPLPAQATGEVKLVLGFAQSGTIAGQKASAAVDWIELGEAAGDPARADSAPVFTDGKSLLLPSGTGLSWYVQVPQGGALSVRADAAGCALHARVATGERRDQSAIDGPVDPSGRAIDLSSLQGAIVRLELAADGAACTTARLVEAALTVPSAAPTVSRSARPKNVVFWMTDDTRSDKYRVYNPKTRVETPVMDALAKTSSLFRVAYVQGNESRVSHASLFTSMYPAQHHFIAERAKLDPKFVTLPEVIQAGGLTTAGFIANGFIDAFWGFGEGWNVLKNHIHDGGGLRAEDLVSAGEAFLQTQGGKPFFLYLGTIDAHVSWRAHQPWLARYDPEPYAGPFVKACSDPQLDNIVGGRLHPNDRDKQRVIAIYDSDVSYNDHALGELVAYLDKGGHAGDTLLVVTSDHGEELWDHGKIGHGQSLREELVHVPLLIHYPPLFPARAIEEGVEIIDLLPTIADALGQKAPPGAQGESLIPLAQGQTAGYPRPAIASQYELAHSMRLGRWKLWVGGSGDVRLFDAIADAAEAHELSAERPLERRFVTDALAIWMANQKSWRKARWGVASNHKAELPLDLERGAR